MYKIDIYTPNFGTRLTTLFYGQDIYDFEYTTQINKPGGSKFTINVLNTKATATNFKMFNKVIIQRNGVGVFIGYIENIEATVNTVDVTCIGMLGFFKKRLITKSYLDNTQDTIYDILATTNAVDDTGIIEGVTDISKGLSDIRFKRTKVLSAWQKVASLAEGELEIDTDKKLNFKQRLGTDKSDTITLKYVVTQIADANLRQFNVEVQGKDMVNRVLGVRNGGATTLETDATSIANFGALEKTESFNEIYSAGDLTNAVQDYLDNHKIEFYAPRITVNESKIDIATLNLGDTVKVKLDNGFMSLELNERIIKREVKVSDNLTEELVLKLMPETGNLLPSDFIQDIITLEDRVASLESEI